MGVAGSEGKNAIALTNRAAMERGGGFEPGSRAGDWDDRLKKERPRQEGEPAGAIKEGIYGAGSLAPINCF